MHADDPEHILWTLTINAMNLEVDGDVRVEDEVQGGHKLVTDSFSITTTGMKPGYYGGDTAIEDFKAAFQPYFEIETDLFRQGFRAF